MRHCSWVSVCVCVPIWDGCVLVYVFRSVLFRCFGLAHTSKHLVWFASSTHLVDNLPSFLPLHRTNETDKLRFFAALISLHICIKYVDPINSLFCFARTSVPTVYSHTRIEREPRESLPYDHTQRKMRGILASRTTFDRNATKNKNIRTENKQNW